MKYLLELILTTTIIFFMWNMLKRIFFSAFYNNFPANKKQVTPESHQQHTKPKDRLNWDAETVEYEEVKEPNANKKQ